MFRHTISSYSFWCSEAYGLMKLFHLCSLVSIADKENGVGLVFFLHHSSSVSRDWEEETGPSFLRIPQVQGIWRQWICEGLSASFSAQSKNAPGVKRRKEKKKRGEKTPPKYQKLFWCHTTLLPSTLFEWSAVKLPWCQDHGMVLLCSGAKLVCSQPASGETWKLYPHLHLGKASITPFSVLEHNLLEREMGSQGFLGLFSLLCRLSGILNTHDPY